MPAVVARRLVSLCRLSHRALADLVVGAGQAGGGLGPSSRAGLASGHLAGLAGLAGQFALPAAQWFRVGDRLDGLGGRPVGVFGERDDRCQGLDAQIYAGHPTGAGTGRTPAWNQR